MSKKHKKILLVKLFLQLLFLSTFLLLVSNQFGSGNIFINGARQPSVLKKLITSNSC